MKEKHEKPRIRIDAEGVYDLDSALLSEELKNAALDCIRHQKSAAAQDYADFRPLECSLEKTSAGALNEVLARRLDVHGISTDRSISNVISFRLSGKSNAIANNTVEQSRKTVDTLVTQLLSSIFVGNKKLRVESSGHFWYPAGSYMAWHTNSKVPGWRMYINYAEEADKSYFRYKDPDSAKIVTLNDSNWNLRLFRITDERPVWHTVYSNTNRFSLGYIIRDQAVRSPVRRALRKVKRLATAQGR